MVKNVTFILHEFSLGGTNLHWWAEQLFWLQVWIFLNLVSTNKHTHFQRKQGSKYKSIKPHLNCNSYQDVV